MRLSSQPVDSLRSLAALALAGLLASSCSCDPKAGGAVAAGTGLKELTWDFRPGPGKSLPPARAVLHYDGTATIDVGGGAQPTTLGPVSMAEIQASLEECRPLAGTEQGDAACADCSHATVEVTPARGAPWKLTQHGADAGPPPVQRLFAAILGAVRPR